jgi:hypothetical protein
MGAGYDSGDGPPGVMQMRRVRRGPASPLSRHMVRVEKDYARNAEALAARAALPLTDLQRRVFDSLTEHPARPSAIAAAAGLKPEQVKGAVRFLCGKGLASKTADGWRRA